MDVLKNEFIRICRSQAVRHTLIQYSSYVLSLLLGLVTAPIVARSLHPSQYGLMTFIMSLVSFASIFFEFGLFEAVSRLLASIDDKMKERRITGALIVGTVGVGILFSLVIFAFSFAVDSIFKTKAGYILRVVSPLLLVFPFQSMFQLLSKGMNDFRTYALFNVVPKVLYLVGVLYLLKTFSVTVTGVLRIYLISMIIGVLYLSWKLRPVFDNLKECFGDIYLEIKNYGFDIYTGKIIGSSSYETDKIFIAYFVNTEWVGYYGLANFLVVPVVMFSTFLFSSLFKSCVGKGEISFRFIMYNFLWLFFSLSFIAIFGRNIIIFLFSDQYLPSLSILLPFVFAGFFQGLYQPYNMYLAAKGESRLMKNMSVIYALSNLILNCLLIKVMGAVGGAFASLTVNLLWLLMCFYYYKRLSKREYC